MDDILRCICAEKGVFLRSEAEALGYHDTAMARLVRDKTWHRVRRGAYTFTDVWRPLDAAGRYALVCRAGLRQAKTEVLLSHVSSIGEHLGPLWGLDLTTVHLTRPDGRSGRKERGIQQHQGRLSVEDRVVRRGVPVTSATRSVLDLTTVAGTEACLCVMDNFLHRGLTDDALLETGTTAMRHWPGSLTTDLVVRLSDARSESVGETRTRYLCFRHGLPSPLPQYEIVDGRGQIVARVDFAWPELGVFLEFDGRVKYTSLLKDGESPADVVLREKRREELVCRLTGWRCIRLVWSDLEQPSRTASLIRSTLFPAETAA